MPPSHEPVFQTTPQDRSEWWALLRRLVGWVFDVDVPEVGCPPKEVARVQAELEGKPVPSAVVEWMAFIQSLREAPEIVADSYWGHSFSVEDAPANEALAVNCWRECAQWSIPYCELGNDDPPVWAFDFVQKRKRFVHRRSYGQAPLTVYALHCVLNYTPWLDGWIDWGMMGSNLDNPKAFIEQLRATKGAVVSPTYGSVTFVEGEGWLAWVLHGWTPWGENKGGLHLRARSGISTITIPKPIRERVGIRRRVMS